MNHDADEPDYESYSLRQLRDVERHIDQRAYPDRYARVCDEIDRRAPTEEQLSCRLEIPREPMSSALHQHLRVAAVLSGGASVFALSATLYTIIVGGFDPLLDQLDRPAYYLVVFGVAHLVVIGASWEFAKGAAWPRYLLWPVSVLRVLDLGSGAIVGAYTIWLLWKTRRSAPPSSSPAI